jgi:hypothetical protein
MTTLAPLIPATRSSKSRSVDTRTNPPAQAYSRILRSPLQASPFLSALSDPGKKVGQQLNQVRRKALVEEQLHPWETLLFAASSAAYAYTAKKSSGSS